MLTLDLIAKKRDGLEHTAAELKHLVDEFVGGRLPDYQMSAWLMAVYLRGMKPAETAALTEVFLRSGHELNLRNLPFPSVDKHSTGGVGDKISIVLAPLLAAAGLGVGKLSGRGLGHTGGTLDKLESIPGFTVDLDEEAFLRQIREIGIAIIGAGPTLAPADKAIYALRDVTATVGSLPLMAASIMSKKLAGGAWHIVLDVKYGRGALMPTIELARKLATMMIDIGQRFGRKMSAILSDMDQPLGSAVGNSLEVKEAIEVLRGGGPEDVRYLTLALAARLLISTGRARDEEEAEKLLADLLDQGHAWEKFLRFVEYQGGDVSCLQNPELLPMAPEQYPLLSPRSGYILNLDALIIGRTSQQLGAGRLLQGAELDMSAGIMLKKKRGDTVVKGEVLAVLHGSDKELLQELAPFALTAWTLSAWGPDPTPLIGATL